MDRVYGCLRIGYFEVIDNGFRGFLRGFNFLAIVVDICEQKSITFTVRPRIVVLCQTDCFLLIYLWIFRHLVSILITTILSS